MLRCHIFGKRRGYVAKLDSSFRVEGFFQVLTQSVHVVIGCILGLQSRYVGTPLNPTYIPLRVQGPK